MEKPVEIIPIIEEELVIGTRATKTGSVRVSKTVEHTSKTIEMSALRDVVEVSRVTIEREVDSVPQTREEGDTVIVPVVEERLVVQKRLFLKEEIHIKRSQVDTKTRQTVNLDREHAVVEHLNADGEVVAAAQPEQNMRKEYPPK